MKTGQHFGTSRRVGALVGTLMGACFGGLTSLAQVSPGDRPAPAPAHFPGPRPAPPPIVITRPHIPRPGLASRANAMPGRTDALPGGARRDTSKWYRPAPATASRPARSNAFPRGDFVGPIGGSGVPMGVRPGPGAIGSGTAFFDSSGFGGNFAYIGDRWRFSAHLGSGVTSNFASSAYLDGLRFCSPACLPIDGLTWPYLSWPYNRGYCYPNYPSYFGYVYGSSWPVVNYAVDQYSDPALSPRYIPQQAPVQVQPPPPPLTAMEVATALMQVRRYGDAVEQFRDHLKADSGDYLAMRWLGVAQLLAGKTKDGCETIGKAYENDPALGDSILNIQEMGLTQLRVREMCGPVVAYAKRSSASGAYLTAAMLMQVRDRADLSIKMLAEAKTAGLDAELYAKLSQSMTK